MAGLRLTLDPTGVETGAARADKALAGVGAQAVKTENALERMATGATVPLQKVSEASEKVGRSGMIAGGGMRNLSLQLSQVVQQGGMTGNYLGALAIQIPDLLLGFGMLGVVIGGLAVVGLPMLQSAFGDTSAAEKQAQDQLDSLMSTMSDFNRDAKIGATSVADLRKEYGLWADEIQQTAQWMAQVDASAALAALSKDTTSFSATLDKLTIAQQNASNALMGRFAAEKAVADGDLSALDTVQQQIDNMKMYNAQVDALAATLGMTATQALQLQNGLTAVTSSDDMTALANNAKAVLDQIEQWYPAGALMPPEMVKISQGMQDIESAAARGVTTMEQFGPAIDGGVAASNALYGNLYDITQLDFGNLSAIPGAGMRFDGSSNASGFDFFGGASLAANGMTPPKPSRQPARSGGGGGGGGGRSAEIKGQIVDLNALIALEAEATDYWGEWGDAGASALDKLISGTGDLGDVLKDTIKEMELAILKQTLLATLGMSAGTTGSIGSIIMDALIPHANGGTIPVGSTGMVGENGPEAISSTPYGTVVTSRSASANSSQAGAQNVNVTVGVSVDDDGKVQAYVKSMTTSAAKASAATAVQTVKRNLSSWNGQLQTDGALA